MQRLSVDPHNSTGVHHASHQLVEASAKTGPVGCLDNHTKASGKTVRHAAFPVMVASLGVTDL